LVPYEEGDYIIQRDHGWNFAVILSLIVGLGNPGLRYKKTRHNLGFRVADHLAAQNKLSFKSGKGYFLFCEIRKEKKNKIVLVKPVTYMNASGEAVTDALEQFEKKIEELLVICDDVNLPLGRIRIREKGSDGGHKGLRSIIDHLGSTSFARLRLGVGEPPGDMEWEEYVLKKFDRAEKEKAERMILTASQAVEDILRFGIQQSMNRFNFKAAF
jgi:PTH1 family peptidyl-tRNA hydrolase